jgi:hypothetical protein
VEKYFSIPVCLAMQIVFYVAGFRGESCAAKSKILLERSHEEGISNSHTLKNYGPQITGTQKF